jgi:hypothetical protein
MGVVVRVNDDTVAAWCERGGLVVRPGGACDFFAWADGQMVWASAGRYSWERGVVEEMPGALDESVVEALEQALEVWSETESGRAWLASWGVQVAREAPPSRRAE